MEFKEFTTNELRLAAERAELSKEMLNKLVSGDRQLSDKPDSKSQAFKTELEIIKRTRKA